MEGYRCISAEEYEREVLQYRTKAKEFLECLEKCLKSEKENRITDFLIIVREMLQNPRCVNSLVELAELHLVAVITSEELEQYSQAYFILNGKSAKEFSSLMKKIRFRIWEVEFEETLEAEQKLYELMEVYHVTPVAMKTLIQTSAMNKLNFYYSLTNVYLEHQKVECAVGLLSYAVKMFPDNQNLMDILLRLREMLGLKREIIK